jgi:hypothetical protein
MPSIAGLVLSSRLSLTGQRPSVGMEVLIAAPYGSAMDTANVIGLVPAVVAIFAACLLSIGPR